MRRETKALRIDYPIATDNTFSIWRAFNNRFWPPRYTSSMRAATSGSSISAKANTRTRSEASCWLLDESGARPANGELVSVQGSGPEVLALDWSNLKSSERYLGHQRTENFSSSDGAAPDGRRTDFPVPSRLELNHWGCRATGPSTAKFRCRSIRPAGRIVCGFHARDLHLVMGPAVRGASGSVSCSARWPAAWRFPR